MNTQGLDEQISQYRKCRKCFTPTTGQLSPLNKKRVGRVQLKMGKQEFMVVQCAKCTLYQSNQKTKSGKWQCKVCNEKQSFRKIFAISDKSKFVSIFLYHHSSNPSSHALLFFASDLRPVVQEVGLNLLLLFFADPVQLNMKRGQLEEQLLDEQPVVAPDEEVKEDVTVSETHQVPNSKWGKYLKEHRAEAEDDNPDIEVVTSLPDPIRKKRRRAAQPEEEGDFNTPSQAKTTVRRNKRQKPANDEQRVVSFAEEEAPIQKRAPKPNQPKPSTTRSSSTGKWAKFMSAKHTTGNPALDEEDN